MRKLFLEVVKLLANCGVLFKELCLYDNDFAKLSYEENGKTYIVSFRCEETKER